MKTAISLPDDDFVRFERVASRHGMNRSEFYRLAGARLADELEGSRRELTELANAVISSAGQPAGDKLFLAESARVHAESSDW